MIPKRELLELRTEWALDVAIIEKDYLLGWLLAGIANDPALRDTWVFKGGTCLRKCYYETYRLSETSILPSSTVAPKSRRRSC